MRIVAGDALEWRPDRPVDLLHIDIWQSLVGDDRLEPVRRMQAHVAARSLQFWGQELEIARHAVAAGRRMDDAGIAATVAGFGLPLAGPELPGYAARVRGAAANWLNGHWLPGATVRDANICDRKYLDNSAR